MPVESGEGSMVSAGTRRVRAGLVGMEVRCLTGPSGHCRPGWRADRLFGQHGSSAPARWRFATSRPPRAMGRINTLIRCVQTIEGAFKVGKHCLG